MAASTGTSAIGHSSRTQFVRASLDRASTRRDHLCREPLFPLTWEQAARDGFRDCGRRGQLRRRGKAPSSSVARSNACGRQAGRKCDERPAPDTRHCFQQPRRPHASDPGDAVAASRGIAAPSSLPPTRGSDSRSCTRSRPPTDNPGTKKSRDRQGGTIRSRPESHS